MAYSKIKTAAFFLALTFILTLSLAACGGGNDPSPTPDNSPSASAYAGDTIQFGGYDWLVLDVQDGKAFIVSEDVLEKRAYHSESGDITWGKCDLRKYLNDDFYNTFSAEEKEKITQTKVVNNDNPKYRGLGGNDTTDKIFLLSFEEAEEYFAANDARSARIEDNNGRESPSNWWLRTPGQDSFQAIFVDTRGGYTHSSTSGNHSTSKQGIRPAMWITL